MSATGLDVFDKTIQATNVWLNEIMEAIGRDRQVSWPVLGAVLRAVRDRIPVELAAHLGSHSPGRTDLRRGLVPNTQGPRIGLRPPEPHGCVHRPQTPVPPTSRRLMSAPLGWTRQRY
jgi:hypothetical protein